MRVLTLAVSAAGVVALLGAGAASGGGPTCFNRDAERAGAPGSPGSIPSASRRAGEVYQRG
jgi:hypothetical protein